MFLLIIMVVLVIIVITLMYGIIHWQSATKELRTKLEAARIPIRAKIFDPNELIGLPKPVQRYFLTVLKDGQPIIAAVSVKHTGIFNMSETGEQWRPFISTQRIITQRPGFDWEGRIEMMPGLTVRVHDAYIAGEGILHASLFGLVSLVKLRGTPEMAQGQLMRFFAETACYPTALLPSQGVQWEAVNETSAKATLKDGEIALTLLFIFDGNGLLKSVRAEARGRTVSSKVIPTPWEGKWSNYEQRNGMLIPLQGEVAWILPDGPKHYWRGRIEEISYEFAQ